MKRLAVAACLVSMLAHAPAVEVVKNVMVLNPEDMEHCEAGGGCAVITNKKLGELVRQAQCKGLDS